MQTATRRLSGAVSVREFAQSMPGKVALGFAATLLVAAAARVSIPLWFTPVPLTLQPLAVLCVGLALGPMTGFFAMVAYLAEGALGLPVFSPLGVGGVAQLMGPTGGFLMSYPLVALIAGGLTRRLGSLPGFAAAALGCTAAVVVLFVCGAVWFMSLSRASASYVWIATVAPFLPGEAIKICVAAGLYGALARSART